MRTIFRFFVEAIIIIFLFVFFDVPSKLSKYTSENFNTEEILNDCREYVSDGMSRVNDFYNEYASDVVDDCKECISEGTERVKKFCTESDSKIIEDVRECVSEEVSNVSDYCSETASELIETISEKVLTPDEKWILVADNVEATVYNAVPSQCDDDPTYTASMFRLNLDDVYSHKIIAMERTFMKRLGLKYGDVVKIEGTGRWDGVWQIQDTMSTRFAGQKKIDFLVPQHVYRGKWSEVKIYSLLNKKDTDIYKYHMAPQAEMV